MGRLLNWGDDVSGISRLNDPHIGRNVPVDFTSGVFKDGSPSLIDFSPGGASWLAGLHWFIMKVEGMIAPLVTKEQLKLNTYTPFNCQAFNAKLTALY